MLNISNLKGGGDYVTPNICFNEETNKIILEPEVSASLYEWVDLGLPSGLKWSAWNVGATKPEEVGLFFAWGETQGYHLIIDTNDPNADIIFDGRDFKWADYTLCDGLLSNMLKYNATDGLTILEASDDAAYATDSSCRIPTKDECQELIDNTTSKCVDDYNGAGIPGCIFTSNINGNSIFIPAKGIGSNEMKMGGLWLSNLSSYADYFATIFAITYMGNGISDQLERCVGVPLRPVKE